MKPSEPATSTWPRPSSSRRQEVKATIDRLIVAKDDRAWREVTSYASNYSNKHAEIIQKAEKYLTGRNIRHRAKADQLIVETKTAWDRADYEEARKAANSARDVAGLKSTEEKARNYLAGQRDVRRRGKEVSQWLEAVKRLSKEGDYFVRVRRVRVQPGCRLWERHGAELKVRLRVNGTEYWTKLGQGNEVDFDELLGPFRCAPGGKGRVEVTAVDFDVGWLVGDIHEEADFQRDCDVLLFTLDSTVEATCGNGKKITVVLQCPEMRLPLLPPYEGR